VSGADSLRAARPIERTPALSPAVFRQKYERPQTPVLLTGALDDRSAMKRWSLESLARTHGDVRVRIRMSERGKPQLFDGDWRLAFDFDDVTLKAAIERVLDPVGPVAYVQHCNLGTKAPDLEAEIGAFPYAPRRLCSPPLLWISGPGTVNPLHWDYNHVALTQVIGEKNFVIFPPRESPKIASFVDGKVWRTTGLDLGAIDRARFPDADRAEAWTCTVKPGDVLFIPYRWWHYMSSDTYSISVSWWWAPSVAIHLRDTIRFAATNGLQRALRAVARHG
jgi:[protein]-arginine 3-hydroxylase / protease